MKFNELFTDTDGIFTQVFIVDFPDVYREIFDTNDPVVLDRWTWLKYGNRELLETVTADTFKSFVGGVIAVNADTWTHIAYLLAQKYDCLKPTVKETTTTTTATTATSETNEDINAKKVFNDEQFNDNERNQTNGTGSRQDEQSTKYSESGVGSGVLNSTVIQKEKALRQDDYRRTVIAELVNEITLSIYK